MVAGHKPVTSSDNHKRNIGCHDPSGRYSLQPVGAGLRYNAMSVLDRYYLNETKIIDHASKLIEDPVDQVQNMARRLLREAQSY